LPTVKKKEDLPHEEEGCITEPKPDYYTRLRQYTIVLGRLCGQNSIGKPAGGQLFQGKAHVGHIPILLFRRRMGASPIMLLGCPRNERASLKYLLESLLIDIRRRYFFSSK
jgi:hypothetical protein